MKAVVLAGTGDVRVEEVEDARIVADTDALVEVHRT
ncbi:MAG: IMP dehydrogenase, partial [Actinobacteria bacterium]